MPDSADHTRLGGGGQAAAPAELSLPIHAETLTVSKRRIETVVRAARTTLSREMLVEEDLAHEHVVVERVPIGRPVDAVPPMREEGDMIILPVVEEIVVVERRLILREEVRLRRVRSVRRHAETVVVREQQAVVTRTQPERDGSGGGTPPFAMTSNLMIDQKDLTMIDETPNTYGNAAAYGVTNPYESAGTYETVVAVFDSPLSAQEAIRDLRSAGIAESAISQHGGTSTAGTAPVAERGFWASLFGGEPDHSTEVYDRSLETGSIVVTVKAAETEISQVTQILEQHHPVDIDERAVGYGLGQTASSHIETAGPASVPTMAAPGKGMPDVGMVGTRVGDSAETIQLAEETLTVGKRLVNRGGTRIRRFVVEKPVEEQVTLHDEKVVMERRPVTDGRPLAGVDFTDKTIEMTESHEEVVVGKSARVVEEVALRKTATERVETVRDTVRREDVTIEEIPGELATQTVVEPALGTPRRTV